MKSDPSIKEQELFDPYLACAAQMPSPSSTSVQSPVKLPTQKTHRARLSLTLIIPLILVSALTAGLASVFLAWLLGHKVQSSLYDVWHDGAFVLDEGERSINGLRSGRLLGLAISSAGSHALSLATPVIMSLYAFRIASAWLEYVLADVASGKNRLDLPTPLQYGLLMQVLGSTSLMSLFSTAQYLFRRSPRRARVSSMLTRAFIVGLLVFLISHTVGAMDLWLHTVASTSLQNFLSPVDSPSNYSITQTACPPYSDAISYMYICLFGAGYWAGGTIDSLTPGMLVTSNSSDTLQTITLSDASELAVLVPTSVPQLLAFNMTTFGARASCQSITPLCSNAANSSSSSVICAGFPPSFVPYDYTGASGPSNIPSIPSGQSALFLQTSNCNGCDHISSSDFMDADLDMLNNPPINSYSIWMEFVWMSDGDVPMTSSKASNAIVAPQGNNVAAMLTNCSLSFYNVSLSYFNGSYSLQDEALSNTGLSDGLAGPTRLGHYASRLVADVEGRAFNDSDSSSVMAFLSQDLARLALGAAAFITNDTAPALAQSEINDRILGQYPIVPVFIYIALMYAYTIIALIILLQTLVVSKDVSIQVPFSGPNSVDDNNETKEVSALELIQLRLTSPLSSVAAMFPPDKTESRKAKLSTETTLLNMFDEHPGEERLVVGLRTTDSCLRKPKLFGVWRRNGYSSKEDI